MALTAYQTTLQRVSIIDASIVILQGARKSVTDAEVLATTLIARGYPSADVNAAVAAVLAVAADQLGGALGVFADLDDTFPYQDKVVVGCPGEYVSCGIDSGTKTFTASGGTPFSVFAAGDVLLAINAEDAANKKVLTVVSIGGSGVSMVVSETVTTNAADSKLSILAMQKFS